MHSRWKCLCLVIALSALEWAAAPGEVKAQTGSVAGSVTLEQAQVRRRTAGRYPGQSAGASEIQRIPVVVYVVGRAGASPSSNGPWIMVQQDTAFAPAALTIPVGGSVDFPNEDTFFHNVFSYSSTHRFDLGRYPKGESKSEQFLEPGIVEVFCEVHDKMRGVIVVTENPFHTTVAEDGSFRIDGLPPGDHEIALWSADHRPITRTVRVQAGSTTRIEVELRR